MQNNVLLSVTVLSYNNDVYIEDCLRSIENQGIDSYEVFVIDDSSTDNSAEVIRNYIKDKPQFKLIEKENSGGAISSQIGLEMSSGKYFALVDSDDIVADGAYKRLIERLEEDGSDFAAGMPARLTSGFMMTTVSPNEASLFAEKKVLESDDDIVDFSRQVFYWNCVYRTDFLKNNDVYMPKSLLIADRVFLYRAIMKAQKISIDPSIVYYWRKKHNEGRKSVTDNNNEYHMISDRCDSFLAQIRASMEMIDVSTKRIRAIWENSFMRLMYPINEIIREEVDFERFCKVCERYRMFFLEYQAFFMMLISSCRLSFNDKYIAEHIMEKKYQQLYDYLINKYSWQQIDLKKETDITYREAMKDKMPVSPVGIRAEDGKVYISYETMNYYKDNDLLRMNEFRCTTRYFDNTTSSLEFNNDSIDISDLKPGSYIITARYKVNNKEWLRTLSTPGFFSKNSIVRANGKIYIYHSNFAMLRIVQKNAFTLLRHGNSDYLKVNRIFGDFEDLFFFNIEQNRRIPAKKTDTALYLIDPSYLSEGTNILFYETTEGMFGTVDTVGISNSLSAKKQFKDIIRKQRIEIVICDN